MLALAHAAASGEWPGSVRMSTSRSTVSGMTFVFTPPCRTVGANVVCVQACTMRASPASGVDSTKARTRSGSRSASVTSAGKSEASRNRRHMSCTVVSGRYSAIRRTTSAALTKALSERNGIDACPADPRTRIRHQYVPFSATTTGSLGPDDETSGRR